ncbi:GTPase [Helicobacter typhlonius]|uniref:GTPase n=1 Tax=Helicobacter typhlonius TaxID=76936 RepID=UPI002FE1D63C
MGNEIKNLEGEKVGNEIKIPVPSLENVIKNLWTSLESKIGEENASKIKEGFETQMKQTRLNILIVGGTGVGKSTTIKALFKHCNPEKEMDISIKSGGSPVTMEVKEYKVSDNITIYDSPGLGDGQKDEEHKRKIQNILTAKDDNGDALIDLALILIDASVERDLGSIYETIKVVDQVLKTEDRQERILIALNKCDRAGSRSKANFDYEKVEPNDLLKLELDKKVAEIQYRILETTGLKTEPIYYSAGFYDEDQNKHDPSYNINKLFYYIQKGLPPRKVAVLNQSATERVYKGEYGSKNESSFWGSIAEVIKDVAIAVVPMFASKVASSVFGFIGKLLNK